MDGDSITLQIAAINVPEGMEDNSGNMPQGQMLNGENGTPPQGQTPPTDENGLMPEMPSGGEMPEGGFGGSNDEQPPQNGEMPDIIADVIHSAYPSHLVSCFKLFGNTLIYAHFF